MAHQEIVTYQWRHISTMASEINGNSTERSTVCSGYRQRKHRCVTLCTRWAVTLGFRHKGSVILTAFPCHDIMSPPRIRGTHITTYTLRPRQNGRHFPDDIFKRIFLFENVWIWIKISLKFIPKVRINNIPSLVQIMAWCRIGDKPWSEPMMVNLMTHICVTWPQWVKLRQSFARFDSYS